MVDVINIEWKKTCKKRIGSIMNRNGLQVETLFEATDHDHETRTLVVGDMARWHAAGQQMHPSERLRFIGLDLLTSEMVEGFAPDLVLSPLFGSSFDAVDIARRLAEIGFTGRYRAIADKMPDIEMIRSEVLEQSQGLDFDILALNPDDIKTS